MPRGNYQNLVQNKEQTPEERRANAHKAGIASGQSRRDKKHIQDALKRALDGKYEVDNKTLGGYDALALRMIKEALDGNVKAATFIRDTIGEKPKDTLEVESENLTGIKIKFVDKSNTRQTKEKDPKIVGEYTPPSNTTEQ